MWSYLIVTTEKEYIAFDDSEKEIRLTRNEALYLSDNVTLMIERDITEAMHIGSMRNVAPSAPLPVPVELIDKIGMALLYTTDSDHLGKEYKGMFDFNELYLLREIAQSFVKVGNEQVGYNLQRKIYSALLEDKYQENKKFDRLLDTNTDEALDKALKDFQP